MYQGKTLATLSIIRNGPNSNNKSVGTPLGKNEVVTIYETASESGKTWGRIGNNEWIMMSDTSKTYVTYYKAKTSRDAADAGGGLATVNTGQIQNAAPQEVYVEAETFENVFSTILSNATNNGQALRLSMRLFGLPFQFRDKVDIRVPKVSEKIGRCYIDNIITKAPVVTIVPGKPKYLPGASNNTGWTHAFMSAASGNFGELQQLAGNTDAEVRYYDFQSAYSEYIKYVNILCRTAATFLELTDEIDGTSLQSYDWKNYRWSGDNYTSIAGNMLNAAGNAAVGVVNGMINTIASLGDASANVLASLTGTTGNATPSNTFKYATDSNTEEEDDIVDSLLQTSNFVQFYMDPDNGTGENGSNATSDSKIKGMFDTGSDMLKELAFVASSGGINASEMQEFAGASANALADQITSSSMTSFLKRLLDVSGNVMKGENVIMPEIYNNSSYDRTFSIVVHLKAPYGNKFCYYLECLVPLFHLLALAIPKQTSANTYGSPFLVKTYVPGVHNANLGIVSGIQLNKNVSPESWTVDGFPSEIDVTLTIHDLYSDLTISPQSSPLMFLSNSSLIEYLATSCGLNLIQPQLDTRLQYTIQAIKNAFGDLDENIMAAVTDEIENLIMPWITIQ